MKILKIIAIIIIVIVAIFSIISYFIITNIKAKLPNKEEYSCNIEEKVYMNNKIYVITPKKIEKSNLVIMYFHGGSYVAQATKEHWSFIEKTVNDTGATIIFPEYPLLPKYNYKNVFDMVVPLYKEIIKNIDTNNLIMMGDSAGGGLALALVEKISEENINVPNKTILISPWLDVRLQNEEIDKVQKYDKQLNKEALKIAGKAYAGEEGINSYLVNPIDGDVSKIKNLTIFTGTYDILNPDVYVLKKKAEKQGVQIEIKEYEKAEHIWIVNNKDERAYKDLIDVIKR